MGQTKLVATYCIDTSALIDLKYRYPQDMETFAPIWKKLDNIVKNGQLISHSEVYREIEQVNDDILAWCHQNKRIFRNPDPEQVKALKKVKAQYDSDYYNKNLNKTGRWADPWIVTLALCQRGSVIANETHERNKIPIVCKSVGIMCFDLIEFFRELGL